MWLFDNKKALVKSIIIGLLLAFVFWLGMAILNSWIYVRESFLTEFFPTNIDEWVKRIITAVAIILLSMYVFLVSRKLSHAERSVQEIRKKNQLFAEAASNGFAIANGGKILDVNPLLSHMFQYEMGELIGKIGIELIAPEQRKVVFERIQAGYDKPFDTKGIRKDGSLFNIEFSLKTLVYDGQITSLWTFLDITERKKTQETLNLFSNFPNQNPNPIFQASSNGTILYVNNAGVPITEFWKTTTSQPLPKMWYKHIKQALQTGESIDVEVMISDHFYAFSIHPDVQQECVFLYGRDITEHKQTKQDLNLTTKVFESTSEGIVIVDFKGYIQNINPAFIKLTGFQREETLGQRINLIFSDRYSDDFLSSLTEKLQQAGQWQGEIWNKHKKGEDFLGWSTFIAIHDAEDNLSEYIIIFKDISDRKFHEDQIRYHVNHDLLTNLPNRFLFNDRLTQEISRAQHTKKMIGVLFVDLDRFKQINDFWGHIIGDQVLQHTTDRLVDCLSELDTLARMGSDEFALLLPQVDLLNDVANLAQKIMEVFKKPILIDDKEILISVSIGISIFPNDGNDPETLIRNADMAMYRTKEQGGNSYQFYTTDLNKSVAEKLLLENHLRHAIENENLLLLYQPLIDISNNNIMGLEVLIRWNHPDLKMILPSVFIPLAEETGLISEIGSWVLKKACAQYREWMDMGINPAHIAVNVSAKQFHQQDVKSVVDKHLRENNIDPHHLTLEITENSIMVDINKATEILNDLKSLGVQISIDDFGTGYSSLSYLKNFPIDYMKIDRSFIRDLTVNPKDASITKTIINLAHSLNLHVVAEGVEKKDQLEYLRKHKCDYIQGFLYSPPIKAEEITKLLQADKPFSY